MAASMPQYMTVLLSQGDTVRVQFADSDGSFEIAYSQTELTVKARTHLGGEGLIYREVFDGCSCKPPSINDQCPTHGLFGR